MYQICDECLAPLVLLEQNLVCPSCGLVHDHIQHTRTPLPGSKQRLGSLMARSRSNANNGLFYDEKRYAKYRRLGALQESIYRGCYLDLFSLSRDIREIAHRLSLSLEVAEETMNLFRQITSKIRNPYNNHALLLAICFIQVTRGMGDEAPVKITEVAEAFASRGYRFSPRILARTLCYASNIMPVKRFRSSEEYVGRVVHMLEASSFLGVRAKAIPLDMGDYLSELEHTSKSLLMGVPQVKRGGRNPFLLAASAVYASSAIISRERGIGVLFTKSEFSKEVGIAEYTLRSHLTDIFNKKNTRPPSIPIPCP